MSNKGSRPPGEKGELPWFQAKRKKTRRRSKIAKQSRRKNR